ncbi:MAG: glycosyltransferase family 4 protein [Bacteroidia bacterium]
MKILQLCIRVPFPPSDGATIAMYNISKSFYENGAQVKILSFNTNKNYVMEEKISKEFREKTGIETVDIDLSVKPLLAFLNLFSNDSYNVSRFVSTAFEEKLKKILAAENFDIVQLEGLYVSPYLDIICGHSKAKVVLRSHNVEYIIWERLAESSKNLLKKKYLAFLAKRLKKYELNLLNRYDAIVPISPADEQAFEKLGCRIPVKTISLGVDVSEYPNSENLPADFSIFHLGSMDWMPNLDAVDWFMNAVYPKLVSIIPGVKIYLAGKNMPERIKQRANKNLIVLDRIDDAKTFMKDKTVMVVPLLSGGGMRIKIIEGMAVGKAIVSTTIGAEGINYTHQKDILIADSPDEFCSAVLKLKTDNDFCKAIGMNARKLAAQQYDNKTIGKELLKFYEVLIH